MGYEVFHGAALRNLQSERCATSQYMAYMQQIAPHCRLDAVVASGYCPWTNLNHPLTVPALGVPTASELYPYINVS
jgi:hypothetical protein